jgi:hypothetical protein
LAKQLLADLGKCTVGTDNVSNQQVYLQLVPNASEQEHPMPGSQYCALFQLVWGSACRHRFVGSKLPERNDAEHH